MTPQQSTISNEDFSVSKKRWFSNRKIIQRKEKKEEKSEREVNEVTVFKKYRIIQQKISKQLNEILDMKKFYEMTSMESDVQFELRCYKHNSYIIIFCRKDNELLCSNCLYSSNQHKGHKMEEADKARALVEANLKKKTQQLKILQDRLRAERISWNASATSLDQLYRTSLTRLTQIHSIKAKILSHNFLDKKEQLNRQYQKHKLAYNSIEEKLSNLINQCTYSNASHYVNQIVYNDTVQIINQCFKFLIQKQERNILMLSFQKFIKRCENQFSKMHQ